MAALTLLVRPDRVEAGSRVDRVLLAAALAMVGPAGEAAHAAGRWDPVADASKLMAGLAPDQARLLKIGFRLMDGWPKGFTPFSKLPMDERRACLELWRESDNDLQRSIWGVLHSLSVSSFAAGEAGWELMGYPGPNVGTQRPLGQTQAFEWDEVVP